MKNLKILPFVFLVTALFVTPAWGKDIIQNAPALKGESKAYLRVDGLACYFCSYGLERFFRSSGKVAAYDTDMKKGVVEITFIKGKPLLAVGELNKIVDDAGYTPRETSYDLMGQIEENNGKYFFHPDGEKRSFPFKSVSVFTPNIKKMIGKMVLLKTKAEKYKENSMLLDPISFTIKN